MAELWRVVVVMLFGGGFWGVGFMMGWVTARNLWRDEALKRGHGRFHWENAKWYWNEDLPPAPPDPAAKKVASIR